MQSGVLNSKLAKGVALLGLAALVAALGWLVGRSLPLSGDRTPEATVAREPVAPELSLKEQIDAAGRGASATIHVQSQPLDDARLATIAQLSGLQVLLLDHPGNSISDAGCAPLGKLMNLIHLRIRGGSIGDEGLAHLAALPQLKILNLPQSRATDRGLATLAQLPRLSQLRLGSERITDAGMSELRRFPALTQLHLIGASITDAGLEEVTRLERLESLYLDDIALTDEGLARLYRARPKLHVHINQQHHDRDPLRGHAENAE